MATFLMTLSDPQPGFQGHGILTSRISQKRCILGTKLLKNTYRKPYTIYRMVQLSMTLSDLWPRFQGHAVFRHWISQKKRAIVIDLDWLQNASSPLSASAELLVVFYNSKKPNQRVDARQSRRVVERARSGTLSHQDCVHWRSVSQLHTTHVIPHLIHTPHIPTQCVKKVIP